MTKGRLGAGWPRVTLVTGPIRRSQTRPINGIDQNVGLNRALWTLVEGMQRLKHG